MMWLVKNQWTKLLLFSLYTPFLFSNATYISLSPANTTLSSLLNGTIGALPAMPDADFTYLAGFRLPHLPYTACVMAAVTAMRELALLDLDDHMSGRWTHPDYPGACVSVAGLDERAITVRFALWLIHAGIREMLRRQRYEMAKFVGNFRGREVGYSIFEAYTPRDIDQRQASSGHRQPPISSSKSRTIVSLTLEGDDQLHADVEYLPKEVDRRDIFIMLIYLMMSLASFRIDFPLMAYHASYDAISARIRTIWNGVQAPAADPRQQDLTAGDMVSMIPKEPEHCIRENQFREMSIVSTEDETVIGRWAIRMKAISLLQ